MSDNSGNTFLALLLGAAIGAAAGILYAPDSGDKTRKKIKTKAGEAKDALIDKYEYLLDEMHSKAGSAKDQISNKVENMLSSASYKAEDVIDALEHKLEQLKSYNAQFKKGKA